AGPADPANGAISGILDDMRHLMCEQLPPVRRPRLIRALLKADVVTGGDCQRTKGACRNVRRLAGVDPDSAEVVAETLLQEGARTVGERSSGSGDMRGRAG